MPERQCAGCVKQKEWGCRAKRFPAADKEPGAKPDRDGRWWRWESPASLPLTFDGEDTYACPRQDLRERPFAWHRMLLFYGMYKNGFLPQPGSVMDQSNKALQVFSILDAVNAECDAAAKDQPPDQPSPGGRRKGRPQ